MAKECQNCGKRGNIIKHPDGYSICGWCGGKKIEKTGDPNERLRPKQVSEEFNIKMATLVNWRRRRRKTDKRYPRYHKYPYSRMVFYVRGEIEKDLKGEVY